MVPKTLDEVVDALLENADFEATGSVSKARAVMTAAHRYFILAPKNAADQGSQLAINGAEVSAMLQRARQVVSENATTRGSVRFLTASEGFRR